MAEKNVYADALGSICGRKELLKSPRSSSSTRTSEGEITKKTWKRPAKSLGHRRSRDKIKVIVSVMMLREGWDVRNVTVVLGLRPSQRRQKFFPTVIAAAFGS